MKHKVIYVARVNRNFVTPTPTKCVLNLINEDGIWRDKNINFCIKKLGLEVHDGWIDFSSPNRKEVATWISGAKAVMTILQSLSRIHHKMPEE